MRTWCTYVLYGAGNVPGMKRAFCDKRMSRVVGGRWRTDPMLSSSVSLVAAGPPFPSTVALALPFHVSSMSTDGARSLSGFLRVCGHVASSPIVIKSPKTRAKWGCCPSQAAVRVVRRSCAGREWISRVVDCDIDQQKYVPTPTTKTRRIDASRAA